MAGDRQGLGSAAPERPKRSGGRCRHMFLGSRGMRVFGVPVALATGWAPQGKKLGANRCSKGARGAAGPCNQSHSRGRMGWASLHPGKEFWQIRSVIRTVLRKPSREIAADMRRIGGASLFFVDVRDSGSAIHLRFGRAKIGRAAPVKARRPFPMSASR